MILVIRPKCHSGYVNKGLARAAERKIIFKRLISPFGQLLVFKTCLFNRTFKIINKGLINVAKFTR